MKLLHLSTLSSGGAFEAAYRLHKAFLNADHESVMVVREKCFSDKTVISYRPFMRTQKVWDYVTYSLTGRNPDYCFFNTCECISFADAASILKLLSFTPDVIMLHWISRFINMKTIYDMQTLTHAKIVWNMLDMAPMTGGCHYAWQCEGYHAQCGTCPAIGSHVSVDLSSINFSLKKKYIQKINPVIIAPSTELYEQCKKSAFFRNSQKYKILLPVDLKQFYPGNKQALRKKNAIPMSARVICFRSDIPQLRRKGFDYIVQCLKRLSLERMNNIHGAVIGNMSLKDRENIPFPCTFFSSVRDTAELGNIYRLSDVFLNASIQDSGPMMINEAVACGLPVVTFPVGVSKDLVINGKTGFIAEMQDSSDLAAKLKTIVLMNARKYSKISKECRMLACRKLDAQKVIKQYEKLV